jgi:hypothetical protein
MKKILFSIMIIGVLAASCDKDMLDDPQPVPQDYTLPQGASAADSRIVSLFEKYGSYFLYDYTQRDFNWTMVSSNVSSYYFRAVLGSPQYAGNMLDLLEEIWLDFYPDNFLKTNLPYRVFLADSIIQVYSYREVALYSRLTKNTISIAGMNDKIPTMSATDKRKMKNDIQRNFIMDLINNNKLTIPDEFYAVSDYTTKCVTTPSSPDYARTRGFVPSIDYEDSYGMVSEWCTYLDYSTKMLLKSNDVAHYLKNMLCHSESDPNSWGKYLTYPLVKKKYDILRQHFISTYGFDIQFIGNANL